MSDERQAPPSEENQKKEGRFPDPPSVDIRRPANPGNKKSGNPYEGITLGVKLAYFFIAPLVAGWLIGYFIDKPSGGTNGQTWGTIGGFFLGLIAFVAVVNKGPGSSK
jgi:F0F1-type ATP synthase assembly protein I